MKANTLMIVGLCAALFGAGIGASKAQVVDLRCQYCTWNFQACIAQCDLNGGESSCYSACTSKRRACVATFCP